MSQIILLSVVSSSSLNIRRGWLCGHNIHKPLKMSIALIETRARADRDGHAHAYISKLRDQPM